MTAHADVEQLSAYLDGEVPPSARAGLEAHLATCPECSARKEALQGVIRAVSTLPPVTVSPSETRDIRLAVLKRVGSRRRFAWPLVGAAAGVVALVAAAAVFFGLSNGQTNHPAALQAPARTVPSPALAPALANDAEAQSYARSLPGVSSFLGQPRSAPVFSVASPVPAAGPGAAQGALPGPSASSAQGTRAAPATTPAAPPRTLDSPISLGSCTQLAVPNGAPVVEAQVVTYQGTPAWLIAYGVSSGSNGLMDRVKIEVRSQAACALLDQSTLTP